MTGELIDYGVRPWVLAIDVGTDSELSQVIRQHFPTVEFVSSDEARGLHQDEFDAAIVVGSAPPGLHDGLQVLQFGGVPAAFGAALVSGTSQRPMRLLTTHGVGARNFVVGDAATQLGVTSLTKQTVIPAPGSNYPVLKWLNGQVEVSAPVGRQVTELAGDTAGGVLAGYVRRSGSEDAGYLLWLPETAFVNSREWLRAAVRWWQQIDATRFPPVANWIEQRQWMTQPEKDAADQIAQLEAEAEEFRRGHEERLIRAAAVQQDARAAAALGPRRLLTAQGAPLVEAVTTTLRLLGFTVVDADGLTENAQFKQEDLRVIDGGWVCLAEVKGYKKGAKASDLLQLGKAVEVYLERGNSRPDARWYIVNHSFETPPGLREAPLTGAPDVPVFAGMGGAVLDTRVLFAMHRAVQAGDLSPDDARAKLKGASGVYPLDDWGSAHTASTPPVVSVQVFPELP